jgi:LmbE family N-acetylglucosaminyl deacetylase
MHFRPRRTGQLLLVALTLSTFHFPLSTFGQRPPAQPSASEILHKMQKLNVLGSVLYIVAHPDDENTRLIAWLANGKKVRTGNLSLTRGDGGQNLIGPELGDALGIIRTQELMEARRIDGGEQFFTRAVDFGYSKNAAESFEKWGKQEVLSDVVRVIRQFRPDIIITRFPPTREAGHGHHEASAILAAEAFDLAGDPKAFPEQLEQGLEVWQPRRLFFNGSNWWRKDLAEFAKNDPDWFTVDVGGYDPLLGLSYTEIAGRSRSMHKSQGFGAAETRGEMLEYLKLIKGDRPKTKDIFEGIDMTWGRVKGASDVSNVLAQMSSSYQPTNPAEARILLQKSLDIIRPFTSDHAWAMIQYDRLRSLALDMEGWVTDAIATQPYFSLRDSIQINLTAFPRLNHTHESVSVILQEPNQVGFQMTLGNDHRAIAASALSFWNEPYWLAKKHGDLYDVAHYEIGLPVENTQRVGFVIGLGSESNLRTTALTYKWVDRVAGERIRPVYVTPVASVIPKSDVLIANGGTQTITVEVEALTDSLTGQLNVTLPDGWGTTKDLKLVNIAKRNERQSFTFQLIPSENAKGGPVKFAFSGPKGKADRTLHEIDYPHIMPQVYYTPAEVKLVPLGVKTTAKTVGYIKGAGDDVPQAIEQLGATVDMIEPSTATLESISKYDAIVVGIRAYNNNHALKQFNPTLMKYVENGGTVVVQYNTKSSDMVLPDTLIGPYPFKLTRDRVTVEEAPPTFLAKDHPLLNTPNTITSADFDGWVQERGLYFVGGFEKHYTPLIAWNDPGEQPLNGGLITCDYGKGRYVYTGISFFRQLPAGVPGAYRLFANLISKRITP